MFLADPCLSFDAAKDPAVTLTWPCLFPRGNHHVGNWGITSNGVFYLKTVSPITILQVEVVTMSKIRNLVMLFGLLLLLTACAAPGSYTQPGPGPYPSAPSIGSGADRNIQMYGY